MSTRIRYGATEVKGVQKSKKPFETKSGSVYVVLDEKSMHYMIFDSKTNGLVSSGGNTTSKVILRNQAKKALESLGTKFSDEKRDRKPVKRKSKATPQTETIPQSLLDIVEDRLNKFTKNLSREIMESMKQQPVKEVAS